ncbi:YdcF family protein, partial [Acidimangrovimonas pyrenivorans]
MFFIASKIVWALLRPETLLVYALGGGLFALLRGRRRLGIGLAGGGLLCFVLLAALPLGDVLIRPLETRYPANPPVTDVRGIIVLGGGEQADLSRYWRVPLVNGAGDRFLAALALAQRFPDAKLLFTGGRGSLDQAGPAGATVAREIFLSAGLSPDRLILEGKSRNTAENARFSRAMAGGDDRGTWLLVTSAAHMPRAMQAFCAAGWNGLVAWPTDFRSLPFRFDWGWRLPRHLETLDFAAHEWLGLLAYRL